jgi:predicted acylesterase/phospholipase RssA
MDARYRVVIKARSGEAVKDISDDINVHLVLGGGGVRCLSYAGALNRLYENGFRFSSVSCCSAGTFIGALGR